jgi:hypothetical protein
MACLGDCTYLYGSYHLVTPEGPLRTGEVVDLHDPTHPVVLGDWTANGVLPSRDVHGQYEVKPGFVLTSSAPIEYLDVRPGTPYSLLHPKVLATSATGTTHAERYHTVIWPRTGQDKFILGDIETNATPNCALGAGEFSTFDATQWQTTHTFKKIDSYFLLNGMYFDGNPPLNVLGCSPHYFNVRPSWNDGGVLALATYDNGTEFLRVNGSGKIQEIGYGLPPGTEASAAYWITCDVVYSTDYTRGVDIWRLNDPASACANSTATPGAGASAGQPLFGPGASLPAHACLSRRRFLIRVHRPRGVRLVSAEVLVNGRRVAVRRGRRLTAPVDLRHLPRGRFAVTIKARTNTGHTITASRHYLNCTPKRPGRTHHKL